MMGLGLRIGSPSLSLPHQPPAPTRTYFSSYALTSATNMVTTTAAAAALTVLPPQCYMGKIWVIDAGSRGGNIPSSSYFFL